MTSAPTGFRTWHRIAGLSILCWSLLGVPASAQEVPDAVARLAALVGEWESDQVEFLGVDGAVRRTSSAQSHNEIQLDGRVLAHRGWLAEPAIATTGWYWWDASESRLKMGSVAHPGGYDEFVGEWIDDRLVMTTLPNPRYNGRLFRMTHSDITETSYREMLEMSEDGGETWRVTSRQVMRRVGADVVSDAAAVLGAIRPYIGHWRSEEKTARDGSNFHFEYDLAWMDESHTIVRMVVSQHWPDGRSLVLWDGFKGREADGSAMYYWAASPSGRGARGVVHLEGQQFVTAYEGWSSDGNPVEIRDVFEPVLDDRFVSRTYLRSAGETEWRLVNEDHWERAPRLNG